MAPRRRAATANPAAIAAPSLLSLPSDLLLRCLAQLNQSERFGAAALVCKRVRALCMSPQLLGTVSFDAEQAATAMPRLQALLRFLLAHGRHVRQLVVFKVSLDGLPEAQQQEAAALLPACMTACGGPASSLSSLILADVALPSLDWLPGLAALRELQMGCGERSLRLPPGLQHLSCLTRLSLSGSTVELESGAPLPTGLLRLNLIDEHSESLPSQVSQLSHLTRLSLAHSNYSPEGQGALTALASLRHLHVFLCPTPACLPALTSLEHLFLVTGTADLTLQLEAALAQLRGLTSLVIRADSQRIPPALGGLSRLQRLSWSGWDDDEPADTRLPDGPWLASIRWLGLPWPILERSAPVLADALQLEYLCASTMPEPSIVMVGGTDGGTRWRRFWRFLVAHPPLRCFGLDAEPDGVEDEEDGPAERPSADLLQALLLLRGMRPALRLRCLVHDFEIEVIDCSDIPDDDLPAF